ncbi:Vitamin B12 transporter BtuB [Fusobacterium necrophorum subsp. funduliforme]|uniref:TonB-dependent receptor n=1 Tax=Fusobacterium necrophorum TaxID=859 RepID=UPI001B8D7E7F|nr:TonB-dependent receptor [Fusobacterium necrophorum]MBR8721863.1 Vitamin B12 transporter BtuB [Fusobacterium necrophorum subsp. funduliforme]
MKKTLLLFSILATLAYAEQTVELGSSSIRSSAKKTDYTLIPKEYKNTYTITQETIRERNYKNVEDVLRDAPGVIIQNTAFGPRVDMRGSGEKSLARVKVLVDGISINPTEETMASLPINSIPIESVKKIEIIPGGGATLYGSGSVGGVVSISTNSNVTKNNFFMDLNYGSFDNRNFGFAGGYNVNKKLYVNYGFNYLNSESYRKHEEKENKIYLVGFDYKFNGKNRVRFQTRQSDIMDHGSNQLRKTELEGDRRAPGLALNLDTKDQSYTMDYEYRPTEKLTLGATAYQQQQDRDIYTEDIRDIEIVASDRNYTDIKEYMIFHDVKSTMKAKFKEKKHGIKLKGKYDYGKGEIIFGYDYYDSNNRRDSHVRSETLKTYNTKYTDSVLSPEERLPIINNVKIDLTKKSHGFYAFNKWNVNKNFDFTTGFRIEKTKYNGYRKNGKNTMPIAVAKTDVIRTDERHTNFAGEVGGLWKYSDTGRFFTRYERGFVTPFSTQLTDKIHDTELKNPNGFFIPPIVNAASKYVANHLQPEITDTVEIGFRDYFYNSLFSASFFVTDTKDEITLISSGITNPAVNRWRYRNIGKTRRFGIELEAEQKFGKFGLTESLTFVDSKVLKTDANSNIFRGDRVPMVPRLKATLGIKYRMTDDLTLLANYTYLSKREARELDEKDKIYRHTIKGHGVLDVGALYRIDKYSNVKVGAKNLFSKKYNLRETKVEALPAPERNYYLEFNVKFD